MASPGHDAHHVTEPSPQASLPISAGNEVASPTGEPGTPLEGNGGRRRIIKHKRTQLPGDRTAKANARRQELRLKAVSYVDELGMAERQGTACSVTSQRNIGSRGGSRGRIGSRGASRGGSRGGSRGRIGSSAGFLSGGGRISFSRRTARLKKSQTKPDFFDPTCVLSKVPMFSSCSVDFLMCLQQLGGRKASHGKIYEADQLVATENKLGESMWVVVRGELEVLKGIMPVGTLHGAGCFGERVLLGLEPRYTASLRTLSMSHLIEVNCVAFMQTLVRYPLERHQFERTQTGHAGPERGRAKDKASEGVTPRGKLPPIHASPLNELHGAITYDPHNDDDDVSPTSPSRRGCSRKNTMSKTSCGNPDRAASKVQAASEDQLLNDIKLSLRADQQHGFRVPGLANIQGESGDVEEPEKREEDGQHLEIGLFPPLSSMTTIQKRLVQRQLVLRVKARGRLRQTFKGSTTPQQRNATTPTPTLRSASKGTVKSENSSDPSTRRSPRNLILDVE